MAEHPLQDTVVAVVGASGALGGLIARGAAARGARLVLVGRDRPRLKEVADDAIQGAPPPGDPSKDIPCVLGDLADAGLGERVVAAARERYGRLDGLVNAAGVVAFGNLVDTDDAVIEELFLTNVTGPLFLLKRVVPVLAENGGFVVNISAITAERPTAGMAAYSASKAALTAADAAVSRELKRHGVDVIDVRPPHTNTGLAGRPIAGTAPTLPEGHDPQGVAEAVLDAVESGRTELASADFG
ncbi:MAG: SDR family NAD(P)-dependent oxidoreductase [Dermatophilaceae bacterium]